MHALTYRLNAYFAVLIVTVIGAAAALTIIHVAHSQDLTKYTQGSEAQYYKSFPAAKAH